MHRLCYSLLACFVLCALQCPGLGQGSSSPEKQQLDSGLKSLVETVDTLEESASRKSPQKADVAVFAKAVEWILRHDEFFKPSFVKDAQSVLETGRARAEAWQQGKPTWGVKPGSHILAYMSRVDGSVQPYAVSLPKGFSKTSGKRWPLHVVLHGRGGTLNEVSFNSQA